MKSKRQPNEVFEEATTNVTSHSLLRMSVKHGSQLCTAARHVLAKGIEGDECDRRQEYLLPVLRLRKRIYDELERDRSQRRQQSPNRNDGECQKQSSLRVAISNTPEELQSFAQNLQGAPQPSRWTDSRGRNVTVTHLPRSPTRSFDRLACSAMVTLLESVLMCAVGTPCAHTNCRYSLNISGSVRPVSHASCLSGSSLPMTPCLFIAMTLGELSVARSCHRCPLTDVVAHPMRSRELL